MIRRIETRFGCSIDLTKLEDMCLEAYKSAEKKEKIFHNGIKRFLPEFNLPSEMEFDPVREEVKEPYLAASYLWACIYFERMNQSRLIMKNALRVWKNENKRWFFFQTEVAERSLSDIREIIVNDFHFNLQTKKEESPEEKYKKNAQLLLKEYSGDPRNLIAYKHVKEAKRHLQRFGGIGTGIANLYMIYLMDRKIVSPLDPENALLKIDIHKGRIPINVDAIRPLGKNRGIRRDDRYIKELELAYWSITKNNQLDPRKLDAALWIIGSEICSKNKLIKCSLECPLYKSCTGNVTEEDKTGKYVVLTLNGKKADSRKGQPGLPYNI